ncbi:SDR family NAD(P)-dependent oxidoreductase [Pseudolysobacter antarcticus]|uniref:SDR family NAD(P)-dependent oxidoreductase n=1 Tax=Pseudolysobacter antarcticus TaxID=2511995 RepID=A0A411HPA5_9GAMM|nr:SDR family NAD(P)-dependent oxidoreductase [Pseudolysobacter antarcticus]QBB72315.1 SDR family NAD(P)-dependent oxidoreductase [Pseudolysobacter antarcticus]
MSSNPSPTALIVGASRGLGLTMAEEYAKRGWHVIATVRGTGKTALHELAQRSEGRIEIESVDIANADEITSLRQRLQSRKFDLLFVNAGVANDPEETAGAVSTDEFVRVMVTNALSPMRVIEQFESLVSSTGTIGVMSSGLGSVADNESGGWDVYRGSKAALNTMMRSFAARQAGNSRPLVIIAPGWVRTDMGGPNAALDVHESIRGVVDTITSCAGKPGLRYLDYRGHTIRW